MTTAIKATRTAIDKDLIAIDRIKALASDMKNGDDYHAAQRIIRLMQDRLDRAVVDLERFYDDAGY